MQKHAFWKRWSGKSRGSRHACCRAALHGAEALERRELLSVTPGVSTLDQFEPVLEGSAALVADAKAGKGGGDTGTTPYTYESLRAQMQAWASQYGRRAADLVTLERIGEGAEAYADPQGVETRRGLWAIKISDHASTEDDRGGVDSEPDLKYIGAIHGNEPLGMEMNMRFIDMLLKNYENDPQIKNFVDNNEIFVLPLMNPDGFVHSQRTNFNGYDLNRSFPDLSSVQPDSPDKPDLQSLLDGLPKAGDACAVPEVEAVINWSAEHHFELAANFHTGSLVVNYPYDNDGVTTSGNYAESPDDLLYRELASLYASNNPYMTEKSRFETDVDGVPVRGITNGAEWFVISGSMQDFDYRYFDTKHVTVELYAGYGYSTKKEANLDTQWSYNQDAMLAYLETGIGMVRATPTTATVTSASNAGTTALEPTLEEKAAMASLWQPSSSSTSSFFGQKPAKKVRAMDLVLTDWEVELA